MLLRDLPERAVERCESMLHCFMGLRLEVILSHVYKALRLTTSICVEAIRVLEELYKQTACMLLAMLPYNC